MSRFDDYVWLSLRDATCMVLAKLQASHGGPQCAGLSDAGRAERKPLYPKLDASWSRMLRRQCELDAMAKREASDDAA